MIAEILSPYAVPSMTLASLPSSSMMIMQGQVFEDSASAITNCQQQSVYGLRDDGKEMDVNDSKSDDELEWIDVSSAWIIHSHNKEGGRENIINKGKTSEDIFVIFPLDNLSKNGIDIDVIYHRNDKEHTDRILSANIH